MLVRCLYASRSTAPLTPVIMDAILEQSRRNNPRLGVTGMLCMSDEVFIQVLEGGSFKVIQVLEDSRCKAISTVRSIGRNNRVVLFK